jgi:putative spermidine/putrescine transport system permease protein
VTATTPRGATLSPADAAKRGVGRALKAEMRRAERRQQLRAFVLVAPLVLFLFANFLLPLGLIAFRSIDDREVRAALPQTIAALATWQGSGLPDRSVMAAFIEEVKGLSGTEGMSQVANRLNFDTNGYRSLLLKTARRLPSADISDPERALTQIDPKWGERETWGALRRAAGPVTMFYLLSAVDLKKAADGAIGAVAPEQAVFKTIYLRTFWISLVVTVTCLLLGYPVAYLLASLPPRFANPLLIFVLLPFWTSVLVRTTAWVVVLQQNGIVNGLLQKIGVIAEPLQLIFNRVGVYIAIVHVLLPLMILPLYSVMKGIGPSTQRAAVSLGAHPFEAFLRVYLPQTLPGVAAGCLLVFISAIGYYVTPALIGGADDQMISYFIAFYANQSTNWGLASALGVILLAATLALYLVYGRLSGQRTMRWG